MSMIHGLRSDPLAYRIAPIIVSLLFRYNKMGLALAERRAKWTDFMAGYFYCSLALSHC